MVSHITTEFYVNRFSDIRDIMDLACKVISQDHVFKGLFDFMGRSTSRKVNILPSLMAIGILVVDI